MDYLKKLQEAMMGQTPQREEYVTDPALDIQEPQIPEQEIEQVNQEAKSPYLEESPDRSIASIEPEAPKQLSSQEKLIQELRKVQSEKTQEAKTSQEDANSRALWANAIRTLGDVGKADVQRGVGIDLGLKQSKMQQAQDVKSPALKERDAMMKQLMDEYKLLNKEEEKMSPFQKESLRLREKELGLKEKKGVEDKPITKGQEAVDRAFAKDYNDFAAQGGIASIQKNISKLENAKSLLTKKGGPNLTGGVLGPTPDFIKNVAFPEAISVRDDVESVIQQSLRQILGGQFAEKEAERLIQRSYNENLDEATNAKRLQGTIDELKTMAKAKEEAAKYFEKNGTLQGFKANMGKVIPSTKDVTKVKVQAPDGRVGYIPQDKIEAFLSKHPEAKVLE